ncbi:MAG: hypothetical protein ACKVK0_12210 [Pirellulales bacterium]
MTPISRTACPTLLPPATATTTCLSLLSTCSGLEPFLGISASFQFVHYLILQMDTFDGPGHYFYEGPEQFVETVEYLLDRPEKTLGQTRTESSSL